MRMQNAEMEKIVVRKKAKVAFVFLITNYKLKNEEIKI